MMPDSDIKIKNVTVDFAPAVFRTPLKFGSGQITDITLATVTAEAESRNGKTAGAFDHLLFIEQPTERDLEAHRFDVHELSKLKPVVVDESVLTVDMLKLAFDLGWSGVALKTCKGQTNCLMYIALAEASGKCYSVQDLTNPGLSLVHSASLTGRAKPLMGFEYNARQYLPNCGEDIQQAHVGLFTVNSGRVSLKSLSGVGLGY